MLILKQRRVPARPVLDTEDLGQPVSFGLDEDPGLRFRNRVAGWRIFYPSRRGGSPDNNTPVSAFGLEDDPWQPPRQRLWNRAAAITDDEIYVNTCSEDYLWIASIHAFWQSPLVPITDDEIFATQVLFGLEDELRWLGKPTIQWRFSRAALYDETSWFNVPPPDPEPEPEPTPSVGWTPATEPGPLWTPATEPGPTWTPQ